jgi:hypothetical protein
LVSTNTFVLLVSPPHDRSRDCFRLRGAVLMDSNNRGVDHLHRRMVSGGQADEVSDGAQIEQTQRW